jgi:hypothetical protein
MKSYAYAYVIGTSHTKEKVNVLSVKDLAWSSKINLSFNQWHPISRWTGAKWHILNHYALIRDQQGNIYYNCWNK